MKNTIIAPAPTSSLLIRWRFPARVSLLMFAVCSLLLRGRADEAFDKVLDRLVTDTTNAVADSGSKKIAVLDFTDISGGTSAFGKFLAEQMSVGMVMANKKFTVVDRAHLRSILAEHQLTEEGLIRPENAKKLGEFSGVDALIVGTITSVNSGHFVTVKILSAEKAELEGATKAKLPLNPDFDTVLNTNLTSGTEKDTVITGSAQSLSAREFRSETFTAKLSKLQILKNGEILVFVAFSKINPTQLVALNLAGYPYIVENAYSQTQLEKVVLKALSGMPTILRASSGDEYRLCGVVGIGLRNYSWQTKGPGIGDKQPTVATLRFKPNEPAKAVISATITFTLDCAIEEIVRNDSSQRCEDLGLINIHFENIR